MSGQEAAARDEEPAPRVDGWAAVADELRALSARFDRKIRDDGDKHRLIADLHDRVRAAEQGQAAEYLGPLVYRAAMVIDRLDRYLDADEGGPTEEGADSARFVASVREELLAVLQQHQVAQVPADGAVDPAVHEVVGVHGDPDCGERPLQVLTLVRRGFRLGDRILRPAQVVAGCPADAD
ncbi:molecular chaperone GrpE (heat shock protein) [Lipingzhangella halophila]|uniref:Molecular chaperone GrpE (Heat shock protein) n=1 Tax=Lipingzhangella halophila TaxID=1783352 RepID=A0A7W7RNC9_9ACTN|nr:nucleotide exchange factor GrpE [Lipingzhangella halophila]MBB4935155.1 molecular chaperone GrpE (heat shock protein) [Lipingzhangella halophila]